MKLHVWVLSFLLLPFALVCLFALDAIINHALMLAYRPKGSEGRRQRLCLLIWPPVYRAPFRYWFRLRTVHEKLEPAKDDDWMGFPDNAVSWIPYKVE